MGLGILRLPISGISNNLRYKTGFGGTAHIHTRGVERCVKGTREQVREMFRFCRSEGHEALRPQGMHRYLEKAG